MLQQIPLSEIAANEGQPRKSFYQQSLEELARSIKERGVLEPIVVRPLADSSTGLLGAKYQIVMGERRFRASKLAGLTTIPALVKNMSDEDAQAEALLENFQREDLNPIERARAIQGLLTFMSWEKTGRTLGVSETTLRRALELLELPTFIQDELVLREAGQGEMLLTEGHARLLAALAYDPTAQKRMVEKVKKEKLNQGDTERVIQAINSFPDRKEAFLRVPLQVTEQIMRSMGARAERAKPYRPQTAEQHMRAIDKVATQLSDLLDERVVEYLDSMQMNQLLATCAELNRVLDEFNKKVRLSLSAKESGFKEVYISCPLCGRVELIGSVRCSVCWSILRRCYDCGNYDRAFEQCAVHRAQVYVNEAENPREYSRSFRCPEYRPKYEAQATKVLKVAA